MVADEVLAQRIPPRQDLVLTRSPQGRSLWWATRYVLSIRTNLVLIVASSAGYFFLAGLGTFGMAFLRGRFGVGQGMATLMAGVIGFGALIGVLSSGRIADWLIERGYISARMTIAGIGFVIAVVFFIPALLSHSAGATLGFALLAAIGLGGVNPPLDAGRLDIMHSRLWGRAESVRTVLRGIFTAVAPLLFGWVSTELDSIGITFGIMLVPLLVNGVLILFVARKTYPSDVATAAASELSAR